MQIEHDHRQSPISFTWEETKIDEGVVLRTAKPYCTGCKAHLQLTDRQALVAMEALFSSYKFDRKENDGKKKVFRNKKAEGTTRKS